MSLTQPSLPVDIQASKALSFGGQGFTTQYWAQPLLEVRELSGPYGSPVATVIYGGKVALEVMDPRKQSLLLQLRTKNIAEAYRQQFEAL